MWKSQYVKSFLHWSCLAILCFLIPAAFGQSDNGTISGFAKDPSGAIVPKADVTLTQARSVTFGLGKLQFITRTGVEILLSQAAGIVISLPVGYIAARHANRWYGAILSGLSQLGLAVPVFWVGLLLITVFALHVRAFPAGGFPQDDWADPGQAITSLTLPVITIALVMSASLIRYVRSATLDVLTSDYLRTARGVQCL